MTDTQDSLLEQEEGAEAEERAPQPWREHLSVTVALAVGAVASLAGVLVSSTRWPACPTDSTTPAW
ncbi:hypothetical protein GCM10029992_02630 [Glycomyces albus]